MFIKQVSIPPHTQGEAPWLWPLLDDLGTTKHEHNHPQLENIIIPALETDDEKLLCLSKVNKVHNTNSSYAQGFAQAALPSSCSAWLRGLGTLGSASNCVLHLQHTPTSQARNEQHKNWYVTSWWHISLGAEKCGSWITQMSVSHLSTQQKDYQQVASNCLLLPGSAKSITPPGGFLFFFAQVQLTTQTQLVTPGSTHTQMFLIDIITFPGLHQHMPTPQGGCPGGRHTLDPHGVSKEMTKGEAFFFFSV